MDGEPLDTFVYRQQETAIDGTHAESATPPAPAASTPRSLAVVDCTWKHVAKALERTHKPLPSLVRIPGKFVTAYPRKSKQAGLDPEGGLATIEAIFIAAAYLNVWDESLLAQYHWRDEFLRCNREHFAADNLHPPGWAPPGGTSGKAAGAGGAG